CCAMTNRPWPILPCGRGMEIVVANAPTRQPRCNSETKTKVKKGEEWEGGGGPECRRLQCRWIYFLHFPEKSRLPGTDVFAITARQAGFLLLSYGEWTGVGGPFVTRECSDSSVSIPRRLLEIGACHRAQSGLDSAPRELALDHFLWWWRGG